MLELRKQIGQVAHARRAENSSEVLRRSVGEQRSQQIDEWRVCDRAVRLEGRSGQDLQPQRCCLGAGFAHQSRFAYAGLARDEQGRALTGVRIAQKPLQCLERRRPPDHHRAA